MVPASARLLTRVRLAGRLPAAALERLPAATGLCAARRLLRIFPAAAQPEGIEHGRIEKLDNRQTSANEALRAAVLGDLRSLPVLAPPPPVSSVADVATKSVLARTW